MRALPWLAHVQISGLPGPSCLVILAELAEVCLDRHEPDQQGEVNIQYILQLLQSLGYSGHVGCEYKPRTTTEAGLGWMQMYV
jgi:hydroxypyruvate isomerase